MWKRWNENLSPKRVFSAGARVHTSDMDVLRISVPAESYPQARQPEAANAEIAARLRHHDPDLIEQLIELYQHRLFRYLLFLTGSRDQSQDLFQETWLRVLERGAQFSGRSRFDTWMFAIAHNLVLDQVRKRGLVSLDEAMDPDQSAPFEPVAQESSPFDHFHSQEQAERVGRALLGLHPLYREVLVLRFHEEMSLDEIARVSSAPLSTVKSRLYRGMAALKPILEKDRPGTSEVRR